MAVKLPAVFPGICSWGEEIDYIIVCIPTYVYFKYVLVVHYYVDFQCFF